MWFYPTSSSAVVNRMVCYNYFDSTPQRPVWTVGSLARTAWADSAVFGTPHALAYDASGVEGSSSNTYVQGNTDGISTYYQHETGTDQVKGGTTTAIQANIISGDYDITQDRNQGITFRGDGEFLNEDKKICTRLYISNRKHTNNIKFKKLFKRYSC